MWNITSAWADFLFSVSNIVLVIGALFVLIGTICSIKMGGIREQFSNERISANETATETAKAEAAKAQLELAKFKAPRSLTDDQIAHLKDKLRPFAGQQFGMITYWDVKEPSDFTKQIGDDVLIAAGWKFHKAERFEALVGVVTGIEIQLSDQSPQSAKDAAKELVVALAAEDIVATIRSELVYTTQIEIQVGMKP
jgi:hypothetical protein